MRRLQLKKQKQQKQPQLPMPHCEGWAGALASRNCWTQRLHCLSQSMKQVKIPQQLP
jgi:hypothetical protein